MGQILEAGIAGMQRGDEFRTFVAQASNRFESLDTDEGRQIAQMIRENPRGASAYVAQFGGWQNAYQTARGNAARGELGQALAQLGAGPNGQPLDPASGRGAVDPRELMPILLKYGDVIPEGLVKPLIEAYGPHAGPKPSDLGIGALDVESYDPASVEAFQRTGDYRVLKKRAAIGAASPSDFTARSLRAYQETGDPSVLVPAPPKASAEGPTKPPSGYRWGPGGTLVAIAGGPAELPARIAQIVQKPPAQRTADERVILQDYQRVSPENRLLGGIFGGGAGSEPVAEPSPSQATAPQAPVAPPADDLEAKKRRLRERYGGG